MRRVYKYTLPVVDVAITLELPRGYKILSYGHQGDPQTVFVWIEVNPEVEELVEKTFYVFGTGHDIKDDSLKFVATVNIRFFGLVWHIYES